MKKMITLLLLCFTFLGITTFATEFTVVNNGGIHDYINIDNPTNQDIIFEATGIDKDGNDVYIGNCIAENDDDTNIKSKYNGQFKDFKSFTIKTTGELEYEQKISHHDLRIKVIAYTEKEIQISDNSITIKNNVIKCTHGIQKDKNNFLTTKIWITDTSNENSFHKKSGKSFMSKVGDTALWGQVLPADNDDDDIGLLEIQMADKEEGLIMGVGYDPKFDKTKFSFKLIFSDNNVEMSFYNFSKYTDNRNVDNVCKQLALTYSKSLFNKLDE